MALNIVWSQEAKDNLENIIRLLLQFLTTGKTQKSY